jgi:hypothetical protein
MSKEENKDLNKDSSSNSSSVGSAKVNSVILPIFNQPRLPPAFQFARMEEKMDTLEINLDVAANAQMKCRSNRTRTQRYRILASSECL